MPFSFSSISLERADEYRQLYSQSPRKSAWYSFGSLWAWRNIYGFEWAFEEGVCWIRTRNNALWAPVGPWDTIEWKKALPRLFPEGRVFFYVPDGLGRLWKELFRGGVTVGEDRSQWEYLHSVRELVELKGNRFSRKRSHFVQFTRRYPFRYRSLEGDALESVLEGQELWMKEQPASLALEREDAAVRELVAQRGNIPGLLAGVLDVNGCPAAYTVGEALDDETIVIHFEKALRRYSGAYQAINRMFLENVAGSFTMVNREEDMGDEGMRVAKMSYHPVDFLRKCTLSWFPE